MKPLPYADALALVLDRCAALPAEAVPFDAAAGRVLAEDVRAGRDDPPAAKSAMDGFALRSADTHAAAAGAPLPFAYEAVVGAGHVSAAEVAPGGAVRIMTGALLPPGADAVVKQEDTRPLDDGRFALAAPLVPGENVIAPGAILRSGQLLVAAGDVVSPQAMGLLASQGHGSYAVRRRPRVGLLALGDELVPPGRPLERPGQLYASNLYVLEALCVRYGVEPRRLGIAGDDPQRIEALLRNCLPDGAAPPAAADGVDGVDDDTCDALVTLGGSHQGDFDFVDDVLSRLGAELHFRRTRINLGGSTLFATRGPTLFFGLPGTPMASWLAFEVLVRPALWKLAGRNRLERPRVQARLAQPVAERPGRTYFIPARLDFVESAASATADGSAALPGVQPLVRGMPIALPPNVLANALIHWPADTESLPAGSPVPVELLGDV